MLSTIPTHWSIGLSAWIIQDGNYPDFAVDQTVEFAVEFYQKPDTVAEGCDSSLHANPVDEAVYQVVAEKLIATDLIFPAAVRREHHRASWTASSRPPP